MKNLLGLFIWRLELWGCIQYSFYVAMSFAFLQAAKETLKKKEENSNRLEQTECKVTIIMVIYRYLLLPFWICIWTCFLLSNHFFLLCITFVWYLVLKIYCVLWYCFEFHCILSTKRTIWLWFRKLGMLVWSFLPHKYSYKLFILSEHELVKTMAHLWLISYNLSHLWTAFHVSVCHYFNTASLQSPLF